MPPTTKSLSAPPVPPIGPATATVGAPIPAIERIKIFSPADWENFVLEWTTSLKTKYVRVDRFGGAGDMGCDVVATIDAAGAWDNFQCKQYDHPLYPSDAWVEIGKLLYYTHAGEFEAPQHYWFVAPQGAGTTLINLLRRPEALRRKLIGNWDGHCRDAITSTALVELTGSLRAHVDAFDFSIFAAMPPLQMLDEHRSTPWHFARFGGGLPARPPALTPPAAIASDEQRYVDALLAAYGEHLGKPLRRVADLANTTDVKEHFEDARIEFYSAESLRVIARESLPGDEFGTLQEAVHHGIRDDIRDPHPDGYARVRAATKTARGLALDGHVLNTAVTVPDRGGICHHLANDGKVEWVR